MGMTNWDQLAALAQAATPGPWEQRKTVWVMTTDGALIADTGARAAVGSKDAEFIAAANPATVLALIQEIRELREALTGHKEVRYDERR